MARGRILVADDNPDILRLVDVNLKFENYDTVTASNGEEALELAKRERIDLIILDIMLPRMDGWQVLKGLKADPVTRNIPVILMTGVSLRDRKEREAVQGVADYLSKPFNPLRLIEIVDDIIEGRRRRDDRLQDETRPRPGHLPEEVEFYVPPDSRTRVVLMGTDGVGSKLLQTLVGNPAIEIAAVVEPHHAEGIALARDLHLRTAAILPPRSELGRVDLYIDAHDRPDPELRQRFIDEGAEVLSGRGLRFMQELLTERDQSHLKERDLVRELNERVDELSILSEMARIVSSPFNLHELYQKLLNLVGRMADVSAAGILLYSEEQEKFVTVARQGLSDAFQEKTRLSLSDPLVDELLTLRRPLAVSDINERYPSILMGAAAREKLCSMVCIPLIVKEKIIGIIMAGTRQMHPFRNEEIQLLSTLAGQMGMAIENANLYESTRQKQELIEQLLGKVIQAQEEERKRLAAEIHDSVAQSLAGMLTQIQIAQSLLATGDLDHVNRQMLDLKKLIADSVKEVRQIIFNLRPSSLDDLGLVPSIENYIKRYERDTSIATHLIVGEIRKRLPSTLETTVFRIVQESLNNIKKHARARNVWVRLNVDTHHISLKVVDDGRGFSWPEVTDKFARGDAHGVEGMKERTALLGGSFKIHSQEGKGTVIRVEIPLPRRSATTEARGRETEDVVVERTGTSSALAAVGSALARLGEQAMVAEPGVLEPPGVPES